MDAALAAWSGFEAYQHGYDATPFSTYAAAHWELPAAAVAVYLAVVFAAQAVGFKGLPKGMVKPLFCGWNLLLSAYSAWGSYHCGSFVVHEVGRLAAGGAGAGAVAHGLICSDEMIFRKPDGGAYGAAGLAAVAFTWSKFAELGDTFFLLLLGKPVTFLQWYHHASVLLYCWFACTCGTPSMLLFGSMNYIVHMVMYFYFAVSQFSRILHPIRSAITLLQLAQMVAGVAITALSYHYSSTGACSATYDATYFAGAGVMYGSYLLLFAHLFYKSYLAPKQPRRVKQE
eukprot:TRINITY_DN4682_c0_g2_i1.p1 TRINITY_DN4682_c0_g2~~TRINITY_DN4682_c0_g2_i1.p1  ORF type:complete len:286 (+),score=100.87 TRINITY_DN4682_c0_g2_i1:60-917(+)